MIDYLSSDSPFNFIAFINLSLFSCVWVHHIQSITQQYINIYYQYQYQYHTYKMKQDNNPHNPSQLENSNLQSKKQVGKQSKVIKQQTIFESKWLGIKYTTYSIGDKIIPNYQTVYRTTTKNSGKSIDGVQVIPIIKYPITHRPSQIVLIANFRPPTNKFVLEFPSGLIDEGSFQANAKREVLQQTGYKIDQFIKIPLPVMYCDPWKSNQCGLFYIGIINGDDPSHLQHQELDNQENIKVIKLVLDQGLMTNVSKLAEENGYVLEVKVWSLCIGLGLMKAIM